MSGNNRGKPMMKHSIQWFIRKIVKNFREKEMKDYFNVVNLNWACLLI